MAEFVSQAGGRFRNKSKEAVVITDREIKEDNSSAEWQTGVRARFPWVGFAAFAIILGCIASVVAILMTSNGKAQEQWPSFQDWKWVKEEWKKKAQVSPSVMLAVMNTITNVCLAVAIGQGVAIAWWRKALQGATVGDLHKSWGFSASLMEVLTAGSKFNAIALAALAAKLALVDNLLLQRAAGTDPGLFERPHANISLPFYNELPAGYAGEFNPDGSTGAISDAFSSVLYRYSTSAESIKFNDTWNYSWDAKKQVSRSSFDTRCIGTCTTSIPAFGFSINCSDPRISDSFDITPSIVLQSTNAYYGRGQAPANFSRSILSVNASVLPEGQILHGYADAPATFDYMAIVAAVRYARNTPQSGDLNDLAAINCTGRLVERICVLRPSVLNYPVTINNITGSSNEDGIHIFLPSTIALTARNLTSTDLPFVNGQIPGVDVLRPAFMPYNSTFDTNVQGIATMIQALFGANVNMDYTNGTDGGYVPTPTGANPLSVWWEGAFANRPNRKSCMINMVDPLPWVMSQLNSIMLRASIAAAVGHEVGDADYMQVDAAQVKNNIVSVETVETVIYRSDYGFMAAAIATMLFCVSCVLPTYYGFWKLGRKVTLGPMEIASAFQAPILEGHSRGREVDVLLKEVGDRPVQYGEVKGTGHLGVASPDAVTRPHRTQVSTLRTSAWSTLRSKESLV